MRSLPSYVTGSHVRYTGVVSVLAVLSIGLYGAAEYTTGLQAQTSPNQQCLMGQGGHCEWFQDSSFWIGSCGDDTAASCDQKFGAWYPAPLCPAGGGGSWGSCVVDYNDGEQFYGCGTLTEEECIATSPFATWYPPESTGGYCSTLFYSGGEQQVCETFITQQECSDTYFGQWYTDLRTCQENTPVAIGPGQPTCPSNYTEIYRSPYTPYADPSINYPIYVDKDGQFVIRSTHCHPSYENGVLLSHYINSCNNTYWYANDDRECLVQINTSTIPANNTSGYANFSMIDEETWLFQASQTIPYQAYTHPASGNGCYTFERTDMQRTAFPGYLIACRKPINGVAYPGPPASSSSSSATPVMSSSSSVASSAPASSVPASSSSSSAPPMDCYTCSNFECTYDPQPIACDVNQYFSYDHCSVNCMEPPMVNCLECTQLGCNSVQQPGSCGTGYYSTFAQCNAACAMSSSSSAPTLFSCYTCSNFECNYDPQYGGCIQGQHTTFAQCSAACASSSASSQPSSSPSPSSSSSSKSSSAPSKPSSSSSKSSTASAQSCYTCVQGGCTVETKVGGCGSNQFQTAEACTLSCPSVSPSPASSSAGSSAVVSSSTGSSVSSEPSIQYFFVFGQFTIPYCGDNVVQKNGANGIAGDFDDEQCDSRNMNLCTFRCTLPKCGDGILHPLGADGFQGTADDEKCDDGNSINEDLCTNSCRLGRCGDGAVQSAGADGVSGTQDDEQCDDGNTNNADGCNNTCKMPQCGDGVVQFEEQCDDGNTNNTDLCTTRCKRPTCGDGLLQPLGPDGWQGTADDEQCDDGVNNVPASLAGLSYGDPKRLDREAINALTRSSCIAGKCKIAQCDDGESNEGIMYKLSVYDDSLVDSADLGCRAGSCQQDLSGARSAVYLRGLDSELDPCNGGR